MSKQGPRPLVRVSSTAGRAPGHVSEVAGINPVPGKAGAHGAPAPLDLAFQILDVTYDKWNSEWRRADLARELVDSVSPEECRRICRDVLETSHRNVKRWAEKAREWPEKDRDPIYSYRAHDVVMQRARESLKEAEIETI